jgi:hypothetical protein
MTDAGFVISAEHGLMVPMKDVTKWRERFPHIPDLEAAMANLAGSLLHRGISHPGWTCPEGWMVGVLSKMNQEAAHKTQITAARVDRAKNGAGAQQSRGKARRSEIDEA